MEQKERGLRVAGWVLHVAMLAWIAWDIVTPPAPVWLMIALAVVAVGFILVRWARRKEGQSQAPRRNEKLAILLCVMIWLAWTALVASFDLKSLQRVSNYSYGIAWLVIFPVLNWALDRGQSRRGNTDQPQSAAPR